jgi:hypothetical protein
MYGLMYDERSDIHLQARVCLTMTSPVQSSPIFPTLRSKSKVRMTELDPQSSTPKFNAQRSHPNANVPNVKPISFHSASPSTCPQQTISFPIPSSLCSRTTRASMMHARPRVSDLLGYQSLVRLEPLDGLGGRMDGCYRLGLRALFLGPFRSARSYRYNPIPWI